MRIAIPDSAHDDIEALMAVPRHQLAGVRDALRTVEPKSTVDRLASTISDASGMEPALLQTVLELLVTWTWLRLERGASAAEFLPELVAAIQEAEIQIGDSVDVFQDILSLPAVVMTAKGQGLSYHGIRNFMSAHVLTDARPLFEDDVGAGPAGFMVTHTLEIESHENGKRKEWFFSVDDDDLHALRRCVDRAIAKGEALKKWLKSTKTTVLE